MNKQILGVLLVSMLVACGGATEPELEATPDMPSQELMPEETVSQFLCSPYYYEFTYYADCTKTTVVGFESLNCQGVRYLQGTKTRYYVADILDYCPAGCRVYPYSSTCSIY